MIATTSSSSSSSSPFAGVGEAGAGGHRRPRVDGDFSPSSLAKLGADFSSPFLPATRLLAREENDAHFYDGLHVREDERELLRKYAAKIPSKREIKRLELEEKRETTANIGGSEPSMTASAGLGTMPRRTWKKKSSEETKEEQSRATKEFLAELGEVEKPSSALLEAATNLLREKHGEETPLDAEKQREAEDMTAKTIALVRAEKNIVENKKQKDSGSSETSETSSSASSPTKDEKTIDGARETEEKKEEVKDDESKPSHPQSLLEVAQNFLKSEEEAKLRAEAEQEAAKEKEEEEEKEVKEEKEEKEEEHTATQQTEEVEAQKSEDKTEVEGKDEVKEEEDNDKPSPKAIEFAKLLLANEANRGASTDGRSEGILGQPTPDMLAAARKMLLKAGVNLDDEKSFALAATLENTKFPDVTELTSTLRDKSISAAQGERKAIPKRSWVSKLGEDTEDAKKEMEASSEASNSSNNNEQQPQQQQQQPQQQQQKQKQQQQQQQQQQGQGQGQGQGQQQQQQQQQPAPDQQIQEMPKAEDVVAEAAKEMNVENEEQKEGEKHQDQGQQQQPEAGVMSAAEEQVEEEAPQAEQEHKEEGQDRPMVYLSQVPMKEKEVKEQEYLREHQPPEGLVGHKEEEQKNNEIPKILNDNVKLIDGDGREYMQPKAHELWNNGKTLFVYPQTEAQKQKPIPDATDLHAFVITLEKRLDLGFASGEDLDKTMWERTQERLKDIPLIHAEKSPGVDPKGWPQTSLEEAKYAIGFAHLFWNIHQNDPLYADLPPERRTVAALPWVGEFDKRDQNGYFRAESQGLSHHYGCLYAHLYQWQKMKDQGLKKALILESDGLTLTRVPLETIPSIAKQMPGDADFVTLQLYPYEPAGVERRNVEIKDPISGEHKTYSFDKLNYHPQQGYAGLASYIATDTFVEKIHHFLALHGADMIDGYILNKLCTTSYNNEEAKNIAWTMYDMQKYTHPFDPQNPTPTILNCYKAVADPEYYHNLNIRMESEAQVGAGIAVTST